MNILFPTPCFSTGRQQVHIKNCIENCKSRWYIGNNRSSLQYIHGRKRGFYNQSSCHCICFVQRPMQWVWRCAVDQSLQHSEVLLFFFPWFARFLKKIVMMIADVWISRMLLLKLLLWSLISICRSSLTCRLMCPCSIFVIGTQCAKGAVGV
jgi:hypothetical protein